MDCSFCVLMDKKSYFHTSLATENADQAFGQPT